MNWPPHCETGLKIDADFQLARLCPPSNTIRIETLQAQIKGRWGLIYRPPKAYIRGGGGLDMFDLEAETFASPTLLD